MRSSVSKNIKQINSINSKINEWNMFYINYKYQNQECSINKYNMQTYTLMLNNRDRKKLYKLSKKHDLIFKEYLTLFCIHRDMNLREYQGTIKLDIKNNKIVSNFKPTYRVI